MTTRTGIVLRTAARIVFPVVVLFAASDIINANTQPGEGFSGGVIVALAALLLFVAVGTDRMERAAQEAGAFMIALGLFTCFSIAMVGLFSEKGFLSVHHLGPMEWMLSTALVFDLGIFLILCGGTTALYAYLLREDT